MLNSNFFSVEKHPVKHSKFKKYGSVTNSTLNSHFMINFEEKHAGTLREGSQTFIYKENILFSSVYIHKLMMYLFSSTKTEK